MCVSIARPGTPKALPSTTLAVLRATPGSDVSASMVLGAAEALRDAARGALDRARLLAIEAGRTHDGLDFGRIRVGQALRRSVLVEEHLGDLVHLLVGALGGEDGGDQQLEGRLVAQRHAGAEEVRVALAEVVELCPGEFGGLIFRHSLCTCLGAAPEAAYRRHEAETRFREAAPIPGRRFGAAKRIRGPAGVTRGAG